MDKSNDDSSNIVTSTNCSSSSSIDPNCRDNYLKHLNKLSHKISKPLSTPLRRPPPPFDPPPLAPPPPQQQQPPVYNISKSDFRDVVQKLTGSPAHDRLQLPQQPPPPPSMHVTKPASSRLQRIRPPPLVQLSHLPPPLLNCAGSFFRPSAPHSPLPPLPSCHAAAESPISAYMRFLHGGVDSDPRFSNFQTIFPPPPPPDLMTSSPLPKSPCQLLSPKLRFSPTGSGSLGFPQLPISSPK